MAYYYRTDAFSTWNVMNPNFPDELPEVGERVWVAIVDGPLNKDTSKAYSDVYVLEYRGVEWLNLWYETLRKSYDKNVVVVWVPIPPAPKLPGSWRVCGPITCDEHQCQHYDNGYCLDGPKKCEKGIIHPEFSRRDY